MASKQRLLLFGINYEPEQTGIGPYTTGMAEHLARQGHEVTVVAGVPHYPQWTADAAYRRKLRARERRRGVDLRRVRHHIPPQQSALGRGMYELTFLLQAVSVGDLPEPDCVIGVVPSLSGGLAAALTARRFDAPLGLIFQDLIGRAAAQSGMPGGATVARPAAAIEALIARRAGGVAVVAEAFRPLLVSLGVAPARITHIPNWSHVSPPKRPRDLVRQSLAWPPDRPVVLHAGNMGYKQDLANVVRAASLASENGSDVYFVLMGDGSERRRLEGLATGLSNLTFLDPQPEETFMDVLGAADILLLNERSSVLDMSLPSKITSYFRSGRPVVAAVASAGTTGVELARSGGALLVEPGDPPSLLRGIAQILQQADLAAALVRKADTYAEHHFSMDAILPRIDGFVASLTG